MKTEAGLPFGDSHFQRKSKTEKVKRKYSEAEEMGAMEGQRMPCLALVVLLQWAPTAFCMTQAVCLNCEQRYVRCNRRKWQCINHPPDGTDSCVHLTKVLPELGFQQRFNGTIPPGGSRKPSDSRKSSPVTTVKRSPW